MLRCWLEYKCGVHRASDVLFREEEGGGEGLLTKALRQCQNTKEVTSLSSNSSPFLYKHGVKSFVRRFRRRSRYWRWTLLGRWCWWSWWLCTRTRPTGTCRLTIRAVWSSRWWTIRPTVRIVWSSGMTTGWAMPSRVSSCPLTRGYRCWATSVRSRAGGRVSATRSRRRSFRRVVGRQWSVKQRVLAGTCARIAAWHA